MVDFHLFRHFWLHLDDSMKEILEQFEFLTFAVKGHCIRVDRTDGELLCCWSILHICQDLCQSANWIMFDSRGESVLCWDRRVKIDVIIGLIEMISRWYASLEKLRNWVWRFVFSCHHVMNVQVRVIVV